MGEPCGEENCPPVPWWRRLAVAVDDFAFRLACASLGHGVFDEQWEHRGGQMVHVRVCTRCARRIRI